MLVEMTVIKDGQHIATSCLCLKICLLTLGYTVLAAILVQPESDFLPEQFYLFSISTGKGQCSIQIKSKAAFKPTTEVMH